MKKKKERKKERKKIILFKHVELEEEKKWTT